MLIVVLGRTYAAQNCSAARALELVGERWSLLIVRDALFRGITRFSDFQRNLGVAPNILATRLDGFVTAGLMEVRQYSDRHEYYEYLLTDKGRDLEPVIVALTFWGDRWAAPPQGPPIVFEHAVCGGAVQQQIRCATCGETPAPAEVVARAGPGGVDQISQATRGPLDAHRRRDGARRGVAVS
jgi:DNA-binding HxlR family transcriptional regulator